jgi:hypothetical protein
VGIVGDAPFGRYASIPYIADFSADQARFASWDSRCGDVEDLSFDPEDVIYAESDLSRDVYGVLRGGCSWADQIRTVERLSHHAGPAVLVHQPTDSILDLST